MNPIKAALSQVTYTVPTELLEKVFRPAPTSWRLPNSSNIDEQILNTVVRPRVLVDCGILGSTEVFIDLTDAQIISAEDNNVVFRVPKSKTGDKSIIGLRALLFRQANQVNMSSALQFGGGVNALSNLSKGRTGAMIGASTMLSAQDSIPITSTSDIVLVAENTVMLRNHLSLPGACTLQCLLGVDDNMSHLQVGAIPAFRKLVVWAVKSYIYNKLIIRMDTAQLEFGQEIGAFKDVAMSYADAEENYQDFLRDVWQKVAFMNDTGQFSDHIRMMIGRGLS